jgi:hypothetical protein
VSELARLVVVANEPEAELVCQLLRTEGIECFHRVTNAGAGALDGAMTPAGYREVIVREADVDEARALLAAQAGPG